MSASLHEQVKSVFLQAIDLPVEKRAAYLEQACVGNDDLRHEVQSLLAHHNSETLIPNRTEPADRPMSRWARWIRRWRPGTKNHLCPESTVVIAEPPGREKPSDGLLRQRLQAATLLMLAILTFFVLRHVTTISGMLLVVRLSVLTVLAASCVLVHSRYELSHAQLRLIEFASFLAVAIQLVIIESASIVAAAEQADSTLTTTARNLHYVAWSLAILIYGIFIPNTWKRAALILLPTAVVPLVVELYVGKRHPHVAEFIDESDLEAVLSLPFLAALIAVYAAQVIHSGRQDAYRAEQLGRYRLDKLLGEGGMGKVYQAEHVLLKRPCAIELIRPEAVGNPNILARFEREVRATAKLTHWNTIEIYDFGQAADGAFYYVMELLDGLTLGDLVRDHGPLPPARAVHLLRQTCNALSEAHDTGLVHRDIKPDNIFAAKLGGTHDVAKLLDFGIVRENTPGAADLTKTGMILGTSLYMSPEQAQASHAITPRSDLYSLGAVAYFLVTGQPPFDCDTSYATIRAPIDQDAVPPSKLVPGLPADFERVVLRCLGKEPEQRYETAAALEQALAACRCAGQWIEADAKRWWNEARG